MAVSENKVASEIELVLADPDDAREKPQPYAWRLARGGAESVRFDGSGTCRA
jgi:hypothetical protein